MAGRTNFQRVIKKMKLTVIVMTVAATIFTGSVSAFDPDDLQKLKNNNACKSCDLSGANLFRADLVNANLNGADLWRASLVNADLTGVNLEDADLGFANLQGANLRRANLKDVSLYKADLTGADLRGAITNGAILCNTTMPDGSVIYSGC